MYEPRKCIQTSVTNIHYTLSRTVIWIFFFYIFEYFWISIHSNTYILYKYVLRTLLTFCQLIYIPCNGLLFFSYFHFVCKHEMYVYKMLKSYHILDLSSSKTILALRSIMINYVVELSYLEKKKKRKRKSFFIL